MGLRSHLNTPCHAVLLLVLTCLPCQGREYLVDSQQQFGVCSSASFQPGDVVLFKRGVHFNGMFAPSGSGTKQAPIRMDVYGDGDRPRIEGPWHLYQVGSQVQVGNRGVLDPGGNAIVLGHGIVIPNNHLASPDAHVDHENKQIILYFHSGSSTVVNDVEIDKQLTYVATSLDGLHFYDTIEPVFLGPSYFRVFEHSRNLYALANDGTPYRAWDANSAWTTPTRFEFSVELWEKHPDNPFRRAINDAGYSKSELRIRHTAVRVVGDECHVFYSRRGDSPERIQMSVIDLGVGDWQQWDASYPPIEILQAMPGWEGGELPRETFGIRKRSRKCKPVA